MTKNERIEAMARAIRDVEVSMFDSPTWLRRQTQAADAWAAADVEGMVREAATRTRDAASEIARTYQGRFGESEVMDMDIDAIVARVMQGAG